MASHPVYQFYSELCDYEPTIWRRFQVAGNITAARLAYIVMTLFEMQASHLFSIEVPRAENLREHLRTCFSEEDASHVEIGPPSVCRYEIPDSEAEPFDDPGIKTLDATQWKLPHMLSFPKERLYVNYDFGDNWYVSLILEDIHDDPALPGRELPRVLDGAGFGIVEDCGGTQGLDELARVMKTKKGERYEELSAWLGVDELDLDAFDLDDMNFRLKKIPRIYAQCYEQRLYPTQRSIDLIERKYMEK